jgi:hypothetical protein
MVQQQFYLGLAAIVGGVAIALFPSNYEIVGMEIPKDESESSQENENVKDSED